MFISITSRCNLKCLHCCVYEDAPLGADLSTEEWISFFDELQRLKVFRVHISGGEPLMRPDFFHLMDDLARRPLRICINTNATLVDGPAAKRLASLARLDEIMVSLDGSCPEVHDRVRGPGSFEKMKRGVKLLFDEGIPLSFYCTVTRLNLEDLPKIAGFAMRLGVSGVKFNDMIMSGRGLVHRADLKVPPQELMHAAKRLERMNREGRGAASGTILDMKDLFSGCESASRDRGLGSNTLSGCGALNDECSIRPDGGITPCDRLPHLVAGDVREGRLGEIWRESPLFKEFRARREVELASLAWCKGCPYTAGCTGGCPAIAYPFTKDFLAPDFSGCYLRFKSGESRDLKAAYEKVLNVPP